jgi:two-component system, response regulator, stage 0 sporulation protein F
VAKTAPGTYIPYNIITALHLYRDVLRGSKKDMGQGGKSVLIADDEPLLREITAEAMRDAGFITTEASDGGEAISKLQRCQPDLVLLDINMPKANGWAVLEHIHKMAIRPRVVLMTGFREVVPPGHLTSYVHACLTKPFSGRHLLQTVDDVLAGPVAGIAPDARAEARRTFSIDALVAVPGARPARGRLLQISAHGFRADSIATVQTGDSVSVSFMVPGRSDTFRLSGRVCWRKESLFGAQIEHLRPEEEVLLRELIQA